MKNDKLVIIVSCFDKDKLTEYSIDELLMFLDAIINEGLVSAESKILFINNSSSMKTVDIISSYCKNNDRVEFIDLNNKNVDEKTRSISVARTLAKIIAGTLVGVAVRHAAIKGIGACTRYEFLDKTAKMFKGIKPKTKYDFLTPNSSSIEVEPVEQFVKKYDKYVKAVGTFAATVVMIFTNFAIDAPLTRFLTGKFHNYIVGAQKAKSSENINQGVNK